MTDQYYRREDEVETAETHLANIQAHQAAISAVGVWAEEAFVGIHADLETVWNAAADRGDTETQNRVSEVYARAKHMKETLQHTNTAMSSVAEAAQALAKQKAEVESEYKSLLQAVENVETDDPRLSNLIEQIETDVYEFIEYNGDYGMDIDMDEAYDSIVSELYANVRTLSPNLPYGTAERFFAAVKGDRPLNDVQRGLLLALLRTFEVAIVEVQAS